jgi:hypothetical protein
VRGKKMGELIVGKTYKTKCGFDAYIVAVGLNLSDGRSVACVVNTWDGRKLKAFYGDGKLCRTTDSGLDITP